MARFPNTPPPRSTRPEMPVASPHASSAVTPKDKNARVTSDNSSTSIKESTPEGLVPGWPPFNCSQPRSPLPEKILPETQPGGSNQAVTQRAPNASGSVSPTPHPAQQSPSAAVPVILSPKFQISDEQVNSIRQYYQYEWFPRQAIREIEWLIADYAALQTRFNDLETRANQLERNAAEEVKQWEQFCLFHQDKTARLEMEAARRYGAIGILKLRPEQSCMTCAAARQDKESVQRPAVQNTKATLQSYIHAYNDRCAEDDEDELESETEVGLDDEMEDEVGDQLRDEFRDEMEDEFESETEDGLENESDEEVGDHIEDKFGDEAENELEDEIDNELADNRNAPVAFMEKDAQRSTNTYNGSHEVSSATFQKVFEAVKRWNKKDQETNTKLNEKSKRRLETESKLESGEEGDDEREDLSTMEPPMKPMNLPRYRITTKPVILSTSGKFHVDQNEKDSIADRVRGRQDRKRRILSPEPDVVGKRIKHQIRVIKRD